MNAYYQKTKPFVFWTASKNNGFNKQFDTTPHLRVLTIDIERLISDAQQTVPDVYSNYAIDSWLDLYGQ